MATVRHTARGGDAARLATFDSLLRVGMELRRHVETVAKDFGVSAPQARLVTILEAPMRMQQAADAAACEPSHLTALADQLVSAGYVTREPDPADRRARLLALTDKGRRLRADLLPALLDDAPVVGTLNMRECATLRTLLEPSEA